MKTTVGSRLPAVTLRSAGSADEINLRSGRGPLVLVTVHGLECAGCRGCVEGLAGVGERVKEWGGRIVVVVPQPSGAAPRPSADPSWLRDASSSGIRVLADPRGKIATGAEHRVVIADEWGEVFFAAEAAPDHEVVGVEEIVEWVRFIVIQCPECEGPEGEWRSIAGW